MHRAGATNRPKIAKKAGKRLAVHRMFARPNDRNLHQVTGDDSACIAATSVGADRITINNILIFLCVYVPPRRVAT
jgi:hypothetical protein